MFEFLNRHLNDPAWMQYNFVTMGRSIDDIAKSQKCSPAMVEKRLRKFGLLAPDKMFGTYTGRWHIIAKLNVIKILKPAIKEIESTTDELYGKVTSKNAMLFRDTLEELVEIDQDNQSSSGIRIGLTRKAMYYLFAKFAICLYDYDSYYAERMDWLLMRLLENQNHIYINREMCDPNSWYPNRRASVLKRYLASRRLGRDAAQQESDQIVV